MLFGYKGLGIPVAISQRIVPSETGSGSCEDLLQEYSSEVKSNESTTGWSCAMAVELISQVEGTCHQTINIIAARAKFCELRKKKSTWANQKIASSAKGGNEPKLMMLDKNSKTQLNNNEGEKCSLLFFSFLICVCVCVLNLHGKGGETKSTLTYIKKEKSVLRNEGKVKLMQYNKIFLFFFFFFFLFKQSCCAKMASEKVISSSLPCRNFYWSKLGDV